MVIVYYLKCAEMHISFSLTAHITLLILLGGLDRYNYALIVYNMQMQHNDHERHVGACGPERHKVPVKPAS